MPPDHGAPSKTAAGERDPVSVEGHRSAASGTTPLARDEIDALFAPLRAFGRVLLAVSGGPDSTALLVLAQGWRARHPGPDLIAATVDHRLRPESAEEARAVGDLCARLGIAHHILAWEAASAGPRLQERARQARHALLSACAQREGCDALVLAHTLDDQAETVLFRLAKGSGISGLAAMRAVTRRGGLDLVRPFLSMSKARLVASLDEAGIAYARDPSNADPRFARPRLRALKAALAREGITAERLARLARRAARADQALDVAVDEASARLSLAPWRAEAPLLLEREGFSRLPEEIALRLLGRALDFKGSEGPVELGKLEALAEALAFALAEGRARYRRTLAGAILTLGKSRIQIDRAPARRTPMKRSGESA